MFMNSTKIINSSIKQTSNWKQWEPSLSSRTIRIIHNFNKNKLTEGLFGLFGGVVAAGTEETAPTRRWIEIFRVFI